MVEFDLKAALRRHNFDLRQTLAYVAPDPNALPIPLSRVSKVVSDSAGRGRRYEYAARGSGLSRLTSTGLGSRVGVTDLMAPVLGVRRRF